MSANLVCRPNLKLQLSLNTESSSAKAVASRRGAGKSTRHIQDDMATGTCSSKTRASCESGNGIKSSRHLNAKIGQTEPHVDKKPKKVKKLKKVKFAIEAMETSDATIKNVPNDEVAEIKNESKDATLRWMHTMD